jgi:TatD DNase family protein
MFVDSHCHINFPEFTARMPEVLGAMAKNRVSHALCVGVNFAELPSVLDLAAAHPHIYASVGVHPDHDQDEEPTIERLIELSARPKVVAIGETGLDYYRLKGDLEWQRERFRTHIRASIATGKPLIIHTRSASEDTLRIMREEGAEKAGGVMHCFTETREVAEAAMDLGFYISFSGILTFKNAKELKEVARVVPLDKMLIETDSPYLAPVPFRGKVNEPAFVIHVAEEVARLKEVPVEQVAQATTANFFKLFHSAQAEVNE